jgi:RHS repeat-associated protein
VVKDVAGTRHCAPATGSPSVVRTRIVTESDETNNAGVLTVDGSGAVVSSTFNVVADGQVIGRQETGGARLHYHRDLLGSTRVVTEGATVVESYDFDPWGIVMPGRALAGTTKEGFTTKERDLESGLDYFGFRHYMAAFGRWTTVDPPADEFPEWSPYNYVNNNPVFLQPKPESLPL